MSELAKMESTVGSELVEVRRDDSFLVDDEPFFVDKKKPGLRFIHVVKDNDMQRYFNVFEKSGIDKKWKYFHRIDSLSFVYTLGSIIASFNTFFVIVALITDTEKALQFMPFFGLFGLFWSVLFFFRRALLRQWKSKMAEGKQEIDDTYFAVSKELSASLMKFVDSGVDDSTQPYLMKSLRAKLTAEQSDEELISWMSTVESILDNDSSFPVDLIPVESAEALDVLDRWKT